MAHFKNTNNELFWLDAGEDAAVWLPQCTPITDEEADSIRLSKVVPPTYSELRAAAYPPIVDQLDTIFHGGLDAWKAEIQVTKNKYPKEVA